MTGRLGSRVKENKVEQRRTFVFSCYTGQKFPRPSLDQDYCFRDSEDTDNQEDPSKKSRRG